MTPGGRARSDYRSRCWSRTKGFPIVAARTVFIPTINRKTGRGGAA